MRGLRLAIAAGMTLALLPLRGQIYLPPGMGPAGAGRAPAQARGPYKVPHPDAPPPGVVLVYGVVQNREGDKYRLRGKAKIESEDLLIEAEEIDYDEGMGIAEARGRVHFLNFEGGEELRADRMDYDFKGKSGTFYKVKGTTYGKIETRPGVLYTDKPFRFEGDWAEKLGEKYILYNGSLTNCDDLKPWWSLTAPKFDIIPNDRALAHKAWFRMKGAPLLYSPVLYKSLAESPRRSGLLTPNIGNSSRRGVMMGAGYYWAINRSYDAMYRAQYFTQRGFAHTVDFRGKPTRNSSFDLYAYGVNDKGLLLDDGTRRDEGGYLITATGQTLLPKGFYARGLVNYLSSFLFRQSFTESFNEAVFSTVNSVLYATKNWSSYSLTASYGEQTLFQSTEPDDKINLRRLPQIDFTSRDQELSSKPALPVWVSWGSSFGLVRRNQPLFQTRKFVERMDVEPRLTTALRWKDIHLIPAFSVRETYYGSSFVEGQVAGRNANRFSQDFSADLVLPVLEKTFEAPKWIGGRMKHTIEPRAAYRYTRGIKEFDQYIRFDEMELDSNTNEVEYSLANRLWAKRRNGEVWDWLNWEIRQKRFFDPTFGGAVKAGQRNVVRSGADLTAYTFLDGPRHYSPIVSAMRASPRPAFGVDWRLDYDPLRGQITNSMVTADARLDTYFFSVGHARVSCVPVGTVEVEPGTNVCVGAAPGTVLSPVSNQLRGLVGLGQENRRGWNAAFMAIYDYATGTMQYANTQVTYNTACCAFSGQYRRFNFGTRNENQFRLALVIANIGSFGTLKRQERLF